MLMVCLGGAYAFMSCQCSRGSPTRIRIGLAVGLALIAAAMMILKIGGRPVPILLLNLLKFKIAPQIYAGTSLDPAPASPR